MKRIYRYGVWSQPFGAFVLTPDATKRLGFKQREDAQAELVKLNAKHGEQGLSVRKFEANPEEA